MPSFYFYFISSLPVLHFEMKLPFSLPDFLASCRKYLPADDCMVLESLPLPPEYPGLKPVRQIIGKWVVADTVLRNELVKIRASRKHKDIKNYLRGEITDVSVMHVALSACRKPSPLEAEKVLDEQRWKMLDELEPGNFFNLDFLIIYTYKLMILERWQKIRAADKTLLLEQSLQNN